MNELLEKARKIKCVISDVDGVLTDGRLYVDNVGNELKTFHVHDGMGLKMLMLAGIEVAVITTSSNGVIDHRMQQLGIHLYFKGQVDKQNAYNELKSKLKLDDDAFAYIGDDLPDLAIMRQVGLSIAVANAIPEVFEGANLQTIKSGGHGAVREACEFILHAQNKKEIALNRYLTEGTTQ